MRYRGDDVVEGRLRTILETYGAQNPDAILKGYFTTENLEPLTRMIVDIVSNHGSQYWHQLQRKYGEKEMSKYKHGAGETAYVINYLAENGFEGLPSLSEPYPTSKTIVATCNLDDATPIALTYDSTKRTCTMNDLVFVQVFQHDKGYMNSIKALDSKGREFYFRMDVADIRSDKRAIFCKVSFAVVDQEGLDQRRDAHVIVPSLEFSSLKQFFKDHLIFRDETPKQAINRLFGPSGLTWRKVGDTRPNTGVELIHEDLARRLQQQTKFTQDEWDSFEIMNLDREHFIKAGNSYFRPAIGQ